MQIVGVGISVQTDTSYVKKYIRLIIFSSMVLFMFVGQILYLVKNSEIKKETGSNFLDVIKTLPTLLIITHGKTMDHACISYSRVYVKIFA